MRGTRIRAAVRRTGALVCCALLCLSGCWQPEPPEILEEETPILPAEPEEPQDVPILLPDRFALPYAPDYTLDPLTCPDGMQQTVASLICEGLFRLDPSLEPVPNLCESYTYDPARLLYTLVLRPGVTFSDGSALTAAHVKTALDRARDSERYGDRLRQIAEITAEGNQVRIALAAPNTGLPALLDVPICKLEGNIPVGTGPYCYAADETGAWLEANPNWRRNGNQPVDRVYLEEAQGAMLYRFTSGDVQLVVTDLTETLGAASGVRCQDAATTRLHFLSCNTSRPPLDSAAFRAALHRGIDRNTLAASFLSGHALPTQFPLSPVSTLYPAALEIPYTSGAMAQALNGYVPERTLSLLVNAENSFKVSAAQAVAQSFTRAGVPTEVRVLPWEEYQQAAAEQDFDLCYCEARLTADWNLGPLLCSWGALNLCQWEDPETEQLVNAYAAAEDRAAAMEALCIRFRDQVPLLPLYFGVSSVLTDADVVRGLIPTAAEPFFNLSDCVIRLRKAEGAGA